MTTSVALLLPVREVALGGRMVDSQYLIILGSMVLWGISLGSTPVRSDENQPSARVCVARGRVMVRGQKLAIFSQCINWRCKMASTATVG